MTLHTLEPFAGLRIPQEDFARRFGRNEPFTVRGHCQSRDAVNRSVLCQRRQVSVFADRTEQFRIPCSQWRSHRHARHHEDIVVRAVGGTHADARQIVTEGKLTTLKLQQTATRLGLPNSNRPVLAGRGDLMPLRVNGERPHGLFARTIRLMTLARLDGRAGGYLPNANESVRTTADNLSVIQKGQRLHALSPTWPRLMCVDRPHQFATVSIPDMHCATVSGSGQPCSIW